MVAAWRAVVARSEVGMGLLGKIKKPFKTIKKKVVGGATYGDKVKKYRARVRECHEQGIPLQGKDVARLLYYIGRADKKGAEHETKWKDEWHKYRENTKDGWKWILKNVVPAMLGSPGAANGLLATADAALQGEQAKELVAHDDDDED